MTQAKKQRKGYAPPPKNKRWKLTEKELSELQELHRLAAARRVEANLVSQNTALVPRGQEVAKELDAQARLLEHYRNQWMTSKFVECGHEPGVVMNINLSTGEIAPGGKPKNEEK